MSTALDFHSPEFCRLFKLVAQDMDEQYLKIRKARKALFVADNPNTDRGCELDAEEWRIDEKIVWDVNEPTMAPMEKAKSLLSGACYFIVEDRFTDGITVMMVRTRFFLSGQKMTRDRLRSSKSD